MQPAVLIFMAQPSPAVRSELERQLWQVEVQPDLGRRLFKPENWHQSLSEKYRSDSITRTAMLRAGALFQAQGFTLLFNRVTGSGSAQSHPHWRIEARGNPTGFIDLQSNIRAALAQEGLSTGLRNQPHITVSYRSPGPIKPRWLFQPVAWEIDEILLAEGSGEGASYHYTVLGRWPLHGAQMSMDLA